MPLHVVPGDGTVHVTCAVKSMNRIFGYSVVTAHSEVALMSCPNPNTILDWPASTQNRNVCEL